MSDSATSSTATPAIASNATLVIPSVAKRSRGTALLCWLRYDPERIPEVEAAYDEFIVTSRYGLFVAVGIAAGIAVGVAVDAVGGYSKAANLAALPAFLLTLYAVLGISLARVPRATLATIVRGAIDPLRGLAFAVVLGIAMAAIVLVLVGSIEFLGWESLKSGSSAITDSRGMTLLMLFVAFLVAPIFEEFLIQGWLQTRLRFLGSFSAGMGATVAFGVLHGIASLSSFVRALSLAPYAIVRATTRSMGCAIAVHFTYNFTVVAVGIAADSWLHFKVQ